MLAKLIDMVLHLDTHLDAWIQQYGPWVYLLLFLIVFCETGLVLTPFLPGDSLLFTVGTLCARGSLDLVLSSLLLVAAAIAGDSVNYWIGRFLGERMVVKFPRVIKRKHLERTHEFYERYGGKTIIIARFVPIIRTFAPFVAGIGRMTYARFMLFNVSGAFLWILLIVPAGYFFGNVPVVKKNFTLVILTIIVISMLPAIAEVLRERRRQRPSG